MKEATVVQLKKELETLDSEQDTIIIFVSQKFLRMFIICMPKILDGFFFLKPKI